MSSIVFHEKPGCAGNARQRALLQAAGHAPIRRDLLAKRWTVDTLTTFPAPLPERLWFNRAAPRIRSGDLDPELLDAPTAIAALLSEPQLIRCPLMQRDDWACMVDFDAA